jgi:hypothetical protein
VRPPAALSCCPPPGITCSSRPEARSGATIALLHALIYNGRVDAALELGVRIDAYNTILKGACHRDGFMGAGAVLDEMVAEAAS